MLYLKMRLLVNSFRGRIGDVVEVPADLAAAMIAAGEAEIVIRQHSAKKVQGGI